MTISIKRKPLKYYLKQKYAFTLIPSEEGGYAVEIEDLPGCLSQGETVQEAAEMIEEARQLWMESAYEDGQDIPLPRTQDLYNGILNIDVPKALHRKLGQLAKKEGVSLNQFLVSTLSMAVGQKETRQGKARSTR